MAARAYLITFTTYGTWLHGRAPGSVDRKHNAYGTPFLPADAQREQECRDRMKELPYLLDAGRRKTVLETIQEVLRHRGWRLWAVHVRSNHVHLVVTADARPEKVMSDVKAWCSRRLRDRHDEEAERTRWTQHGSTRYLMTTTALQEAIRYVLFAQGEPMELAFDTDLPSTLTSAEV